MSYRKFQQSYYEKEWKTIKLSEKPETAGWRTIVPAPDFLDFVKWLKKNNRTGKALDIGCGGGRHSIVLAKAGFVVYGVDFSKSAIKRAKENAFTENVLDKTHFQTGDVLHLPYTDNFFDVVNDDGCLHHIAKKDWNVYLANIRRVLKQNGIFRIKVFSNNCEFYDKNKPKHSKEHWILIPHKDYTYFFDETELKKLLEADFEIITFEEKFHLVTKEKKFFFVIAQKR